MGWATLCVEKSCTHGIVARVRQLKAILALFLAVLWIPTTCHCLFESLEWVTESPCCSESSAHDMGPPDAGDCQVCLGVESGDYRSGIEPVQVPVLALQPLSLRLLPGNPVPETEIFAVRETGSPPGQIKPWHLVLRAALPVRAPSFCC